MKGKPVGKRRKIIPEAPKLKRYAKDTRRLLQEQRIRKMRKSLVRAAKEGMLEQELLKQRNQHRFNAEILEMLESVSKNIPRIIQKKK